MVTGEFIVTSSVTSRQLSQPTGPPCPVTDRRWSCSFYCADSPMRSCAFVLAVPDLLADIALARTDHMMIGLLSEPLSGGSR